MLNIKEREGIDVKLSETPDIHIKNVSFAYPGTENNAINDVSFIIKNGSGKSTLIRLITGLYLPNSGDVLYDDINTKEVSMKSLFEKMSAVF